MIHMSSNLFFKVDNDQKKITFYDNYEPGRFALGATTFHFFRNNGDFLLDGEQNGLTRHNQVAYFRKDNECESLPDLFKDVNHNSRGGDFVTRGLSDRLLKTDAIPLSSNLTIRNMESLKGYDGIYVFTRQNQESSEDGLFISVRYGLYRLWFRKLSNPQFNKQYQDIFNNPSFSYDKNNPNLELLYYQPCLTEVDTVTIAMDWRTSQFRFVLKDETAEDGWLPLAGKLLTKYKPIFRILDFYDSSNLVSVVNAVLDHRNTKKAFGNFVRLLQSSPLIRNMTITYGRNKKLVLSLLTDATNLSESGPIHKGFGVSKVILKRIISIYDTGNFDEARSLLKIAQRACACYGPQVAENMLDASIAAADFVERREAFLNRSRQQFLHASQIFSKIVTLSSTYGNYDYQHFCRYITDEVYTYQGIASPMEASQLLNDYYKALNEQGVKIDEWFPRSLKLSHDIATRNATIIMATKSKEIFEQVTSTPEYTSLAWKHRDYMVITPKEPEDVILEGKRQCHCVGSYVERIATGNTKICFMRKVDDPDTPILTLEVRNKDGVPSLVQCRGNGNRAPSKEEAEWVQKWCNAKHLKNSYYN